MRISDWSSDVCSSDLLESTVTSFLRVGANANFAVRNEGFLQANWGHSAIISPYGSNNIGDPESEEILKRLPTGDPTPQNPFYDNMYRDRVDRYNTLNEIGRAHV